MPIIDVKVQNKIAVAGSNAALVCGNSDYTVRFEFDAEWDAYPTKTARFIYGDRYEDVVFSGDSCVAPVITNALVVSVGVFAGDLHATTPACISAQKSILCGDGVPADPAPDVYIQLMKMVGEIDDKVKENISWGDLQNKPFYDETTETVLLPETVVDCTGEMESDAVRDYFTFVEGDSYIVTWNGVPYECVAEPNGDSVVCLSVDPCWISPDEAEGLVLVESAVGPVKATLSITHIKSEFKGIDSKYLPTETWVFTLEDGSTVEKKVVVGT